MFKENHVKMLSNRYPVRWHEKGENHDIDSRGLLYTTACLACVLSLSHMVINH